MRNGLAVGRSLPSADIYCACRSQVSFIDVYFHVLLEADSPKNGLVYIQVVVEKV